MAFLVLSAIFRKTKHCYQSLYSFLVNMGTPTQEVNLHIFLLWGIYSDWNAVVGIYSVPKSLQNEILQEYRNSIHMWTVGKFFLTWSPKIHLVISLLYGVSSCGKGLNHQNVSISKIFLWREGSIWYFVADHEYLCRLLKIINHLTVVC